MEFTVIINNGDLIDFDWKESDVENFKDDIMENLDSHAGFCDQYEDCEGCPLAPHLDCDQRLTLQDICGPDTIEINSWDIPKSTIWSNYV
jgi:hypothetical protein